MFDFNQLKVRKNKTTRSSSKKSSSSINVQTSEKGTKIIFGSLVFDMLSLTNKGAFHGYDPAKNAVLIFTVIDDKSELAVFFGTPKGGEKNKKSRQINNTFLINDLVTAGLIKSEDEVKASVMKNQPVNQYIGLQKVDRDAIPHLPEEVFEVYQFVAAQEVDSVDTTNNSSDSVSEEEPEMEAANESMEDEQPAQDNASSASIGW